MIYSIVLFSLILLVFVLSFSFSKNCKCVQTKETKKVLNSIEEEEDLGAVLSLYNESAKNKKVNIKELHKCVLSRLAK